VETHFPLRRDRFHFRLKVPDAAHEFSWKDLTDKSEVLSEESWQQQQGLVLKALPIYYSDAAAGLDVNAVPTDKDLLTQRQPFAPAPRAGAQEHAFPRPAAVQEGAFPRPGPSPPPGAAASTAGPVAAQAALLGKSLFSSAKKWMQ
jgi:hypothetical protein